MVTRYWIGGAALALLLGLADPPSCAAGLSKLTQKPKQVSDEDWNNAKSPSMGGKDLRLADGGQYIGGIDRLWWLVVTGPPSQKFHYLFLELPGVGGVEVQGTYEVKDGLAWFQGTRWTGQEAKGQVDKKGPGTPMRF